VGQEDSEEFMRETGSFTAAISLLARRLCNGALLASELVQLEMRLQDIRGGISADLFYGSSPELDLQVQSGDMRLSGPET
jgi:hypothetical protein